MAVGPEKEKAIELAVSSIEKAVRIRTGETDTDAL